MTAFHSLTEAEAALAKYIPLSQELTGKNLTLGRMEPLMAALGNPEKQLKIIHIAGTSGKTSTAYYISSLLTLSGKKTGLTVSPHVDSVLERVQINSEPIAEADFCRELSECISIVEKAAIEPTYFELLVAFAYWYFAKTGVEYAVVETGMGGLQDATNIAQNPDKICVITDIGLDHMHVLGNTVREIAAQKAGIIHQGNQVIMYFQNDEVDPVIESQAMQVGASVIRLDREIEKIRFEVPEIVFAMPEYQQRNWLLAFNVYEYIEDRDDLPALDKLKIAESTSQYVPGRMDKVQINGKTIIMDGAHNEQKTTALVRSLSQQFPGKKFMVFLSLKRGKEFASVLPLLKPITSKLIVTAFKSGQDLPSVAIDPHELAAAANKFGFEDVIVLPDPEQAYKKLLAENSDATLITGSFYLIGQLRKSHPELRHG